MNNDIIYCDKCRDFYVDVYEGNEVVSCTKCGCKEKRFNKREMLKLALNKFNKGLANDLPRNVEDSKNN